MDVDKSPSLEGDEVVNERSESDARGSVDREEPFCCTGTRDEADFCGRCWAGAREGASSYCGSSEEHCASCGASRWCQGGKDSDGKDAGGIHAEASAGGAKDPKASHVDVNASNATRGHGDRHRGGAAAPLCEDLGCAPYDPARPCQCDEVCREYGNCCVDLAAVCPATAVAIMRRDDERGGSLRRAAAGAAPALSAAALLGAAAAAALLGLA